MRVETQNSTFHGMSLHESGVKDAEGERGRGGEKGQGKGAQDDVNFSLFSVFSK